MYCQTDRSFLIIISILILWLFQQQCTCYCACSIMTRNRYLWSIQWMIFIIKIESFMLIWSSLSFSDSGTNSHGLLLESLKQPGWEICCCRLPSTDQWKRLCYWCHRVSLPWCLLCMMMHLLDSGFSSTLQSFVSHNTVTLTVMIWCSCSLATRGGKVLCVSADGPWLRNLKKHVDNLKKDCKKKSYQVLSLCFEEQKTPKIQIYILKINLQYNFGQKLKNFLSTIHSH